MGSLDSSLLMEELIALCSQPGDIFMTSCQSGVRTQVQQGTASAVILS